MHTPLKTVGFIDNPTVACKNPLITLLKNMFLGRVGVGATKKVKQL